LDEGGDVGGVLDFPGVLVPSLGRVAEKGGVSHVLHFLPMPMGMCFTMVNVFEKCHHALCE